jgi:hypothetical protein
MDRRRLDPVENSLQGKDARRKWVMVALDDVVKLFDQGGGFFVCQVNVHDPDIG